MQKQLNKEQQEQYNKIKENQLSAIQQEVAIRCLKYYLDYRQNVNIPSDKIALAFKCAFFMAEKSQFSVNMKGQKVRGIAFSLNKLLKDHKLDDTMFMLKQMTKKITNIDEETNSYMNSIVKQISFLITLHSKFQKTFSQKLQLKQKVNDGGSYAKIFTSYAWLLFIIVKNQVLKRSLQLLPNTCMVAHIISYMLVLAWDYIKPEGLMRGDKRLNEGSSQRQIKRVIKQKVLQIFCIKDLNQYAKIANSFQQYFNHMSEMKLFRMNQQKWDFLSPENININYRKLDKYYEQSLSMEHLDERIFFKQRTMNLTPSKFTPFARQGYVNKFQKQPIGNKLGGPVKPTKQQTFNSHRVLNYQNMEKQLQTKNVPFQDIKLPKNILQSPSMVKVPLVVATPISTGMQMYNFINEKKKRIKQIHTQQRSLDKNIFVLIDQVFDFHRTQNDKINKDTKLQMIVALYKIFSQEYLSANSYEKDTPDLMRAFLGLSMELVFFVSNISLTFQKIEQQLQIQPFEMWKAIDYFMKSDKNMPHPIKLHFLDLEVNFISFKIWENPQMVCKVSNFGTKLEKQLTQNQINYIQKLFNRVVLQIAFQITKLTKLLEIDENNSQKVFQIMKYILINNSQLIFKRHLDQLIICSIYLVCKLASNEYRIMFNDIKQCYMSSNPNLKDIVEDIIVRVYMTDDQYDDIITFYNQVFIKSQKFKEFIKNLRNFNGNISTNTINKNGKKNVALTSPMKCIVPKMNYTQKPTANKNNSMTPQTQLLYAYNQSPILKYQTKTFKHELKSKVMLTYDLPEDQPKKNRSIEQQFGMQPTSSDNNINPNYHTANTTSNANNNFQATSDYISKKYVKKSTTPTNGQNHGITIHSHHQSSHQYQPQQLHIPLQTIAKENLNPPSSSSHRTLFDDNNKKQTYGQNQISQIQETKYKNRNYQFGAFKRQ